MKKSLDDFIMDERIRLRESLLSELGKYKMPKLEKLFEGPRSQSLATLRFMAVNSEFYTDGIIQSIDQNFEAYAAELSSSEKLKARSSLDLSLFEEALALKRDARKARGKTIEFDKIKSWPNIDIKDQVLDSIHTPLEICAIDFVLASRCSLESVNTLSKGLGLDAYAREDLEKLQSFLSSSELRSKVASEMGEENSIYIKSDKKRRFSGDALSKIANAKRYPYFSPGEGAQEMDPSEAEALDHELGSEPAETRAIESELTKNGDTIPTVQFSATSEEISNNGRVMGNRWIFKVDDDLRSDYEIAYDLTSKAIEKSWDKHLRGNGTRKFIRVSEDVSEKLDLLADSGVADLISELNDPKASRIISEIEQGFGSSSDLGYLNRYQNLDYLESRFKNLPQKLNRLRKLPEMLEEFKTNAAAQGASKSRLVDDASERDKQAREPLAEGYMKQDKFSQYGEAYGEMWGTICDLSKSFGDGEYSDGFKKAVAEFIVNAQVTIDETRDKIKTRAMGKPMTMGDKNLVFETMGLNQISRMALGFTDDKAMDLVIKEHPAISTTAEDQIASMRKYSIDKVVCSPLFIKGSKHAPHKEMNEIDRKIDSHRKSLSKKISYSEFLISGATIDKELNQLIAREGPYAELACLYATYSISFKQDIYEKARIESRDLKSLYDLSNKYPHSTRIFKDILSQDISQKMTAEYRASKGLEMNR